jgi:ADP-heptose:LPS heptosyltransferase
MKLSSQRKIDLVIGTFICRIFSLFSKKHKDIYLKTKPKKILIILLSEMGSIVLARPMFDHIKKRYPEASIYVLLFDQNKEVLELLDVIPLNNILVVSNASLLRLLKDSISILVKLHQIKIDTVLDCELFSRISSIYSFLSGAKNRVGFHPHTQEGLFRGDFISHPVLYNPYIHIARQFITLVEALESDRIPAVKRNVNLDHLKVPPLKVEKNEIKHVLDKFRSDFPHITGKKLVLIYVGGGLLPIRAWPLQYFCRLVKDLVHNGYTAGIIGLEDDKKMANEILSYCGHDNCIDLTGYTETIRKLMIIFHFASLLITNDGGPGHFAAMTPIPAIIFYGPETPTLYGSLSAASINFYVQLSCSPCLTAYNHRNSPCDGDNLCLKNISPGDVLKKAYEILEGQENISFTLAN